MGYVVLHIEKAAGTDAAMSGHVERRITPANVITTLTYLNEELVEFPKGVTNRTEAIQHRLDNAGLERKIGKNQVRALRVMLSGSPEDMKRIRQAGQLDAWAKDSCGWLQKTFGKENVVSALLHLDEKTPHIHATVVPITRGERRKAKLEREKNAQSGKRTYRTKKDRPRLCADDVMARDKLKAYQTTYAEAMAKYGLQRGVEGSEAKHISTQQYYREVFVRKNEMAEQIEAMIGQKETLTVDIAALQAQQRAAQTDCNAIDEQRRKKKEELEHMQRQEIEKLEAISGLSAEEAKERMVESLKEEAKTQAQSYINDIMDDAKLTASKEAKRIVIQSIQRVATETAIENSVTVFHIESDEIKGRIIGREGRNIRALEAATGVEIVVDDTPEAIVLSAFDPVRREIARLALHQLVTDGRIHPARIEEVVAKVRKQVEEEIIETGKRTTIDLGIHGLHPELIRIIGKMKYRSSYGQNLLQHARETANLCAVMASELGLNPKKAKRAGLLHDIGKVPDEEPELPHALYGMKLAEKFKEKPDICNAIGAHHDEVEMTSLLAPIVQVCDAISGARPGARREIVEAYIKRLNDLEQLAMSYPGVTKTYAIQAGRELRVIVGADKIDDKQTENLSGEIAKKIQDEMTYPGQVKITVIRETRAVSYAK